MRNSNNIAIIHYQPLELYPPILNLLEFIKCNVQDLNLNFFKFYVFSISHRILRNDEAIEDKNKIKITRIKNRATFCYTNRMHFIYFNIYVFLKLVLLRPTKIIYYETHSAFPVILYKLINKNIQLCIHYHEFTSPKQYLEYNLFIRFVHLLEVKYLYNLNTTIWISHTNNYRLKLFNSNYLITDQRKLKALPNYPPRSWAFDPTQNMDHNYSDNIPIKLVYIGNLSEKNMYVEELFEWVKAHEENFNLDIYGHYISDNIKIQLNKKYSSCIKHKGALEYSQLQEILPNYDIGVIIYKGSTENIKYSEPNKLFEYLICGLDVWCSSDLILCFDHQTRNTYPQVIMVDFNKIYGLNWKEIIKRKDKEYLPINFNCDTVFANFFSYIL